MKILIIANSLWNINNYRLELIKVSASFSTLISGGNEASKTINIFLLLFKKSFLRIR